MPSPSQNDRLAIAVTAGCSLRTVDRIYKGSRATSANRDRITRAALSLGLPIPPVAPIEPELGSADELAAMRAKLGLRRAGGAT